MTAEDRKTFLDICTVLSQEADHRELTENYVFFAKCIEELRAEQPPRPVKCPRCNLPVHSKTVGLEAKEYDRLLVKKWTEGSIAFLKNAALNEIEDCPYNDDIEPAFFRAWQGGVWYARARLLIAPEKYTPELIAKYISDFDNDVTN